MKYDEFKPGVKFTYKNKDLMVLDYWFDCGGNIMIVQAIKYKINESTRLLWVYDIWDHQFVDCKLTP
jgi:hypothetical protein